MSSFEISHRRKEEPLAGSGPTKSASPSTGPAKAATIEGKVDELVAFLETFPLTNIGPSLPPLQRPLGIEQATDFVHEVNRVAPGKPLAEQIAVAWGVNATAQQAIDLLLAETQENLGEMRREAAVVLARVWPQTVPDDQSPRLRAALLQVLAAPDFPVGEASGALLRFTLGKAFPFESARPVMHLLAMQTDDDSLFEDWLRHSVDYIDECETACRERLRNYAKAAGVSESVCYDSEGEFECPDHIELLARELVVIENFSPVVGALVTSGNLQRLQQLSEQWPISVHWIYEIASEASFLPEKLTDDDYIGLHLIRRGDGSLLTKRAVETQDKDFLELDNYRGPISADDSYLQKVWKKRLRSLDKDNDWENLPLCFHDMLKKLSGIDETQPLVLAGLGRSLQLKECLTKRQAISGHSLEADKILQAAIFSGNTECVAVVLGDPADAQGYAERVNRALKFSTYLPDGKAEMMLSYLWQLPITERNLDDVIVTDVPAVNLRATAYLVEKAGGRETDVVQKLLNDSAQPYVWTAFTLSTGGPALPLKCIAEIDRRCTDQSAAVIEAWLALKPSSEQIAKAFAEAVKRDSAYTLFLLEKTMATKRAKQE